ncbi:MAG: 50S ribosomal protein L6, partial [Bacilli bacterium]|nr:50S ribosomal protein L6 [Bacilli bacterium]
LSEKVATVKGAKGEVSVLLPQDVSVEVKDGTVSLKIKQVEDMRQANMNEGTLAANLKNAFHGVSVGWKKELEVAGTGYRASMKGKTVSMFLGYSHDVNIDPVGQYTKISTPDETHIVVEGCDKQEVGQTAALIYDSHRPDVYGNKGVHFKGQHMIKKVGKRAAAAAPAKK